MLLENLVPQDSWVNLVVLENQDVQDLLVREVKWESLVHRDLQDPLEDQESKDSGDPLENLETAVKLAHLEVQEDQVGFDILFFPK